MTKKQLEELYKAEMSASVPDMEALWEKIDGRLNEKEIVPTKQEKKKPTVNLWRAGAVMAACAAIIFVIPNVLRSSENYADTQGVALNNSVNADCAAEDSAGAFEEAAVENVCEESVATNGILSYEELSFPESYLKNVEFSGETDNEQYFVEEDILVETECFIDAVVDNVYASADGDCVYYELTAKSSYGELYVPESVTILSRSKHEMYVGREYFIPVKESEYGLQTVSDSVPQIEMTADSGIVYYNGWESLDNVSSQSILYPQKKVDDFFYDRMMFSPWGDVTPLIDKWNFYSEE